MGTNAVYGDQVKIRARILGPSCTPLVPRGLLVHDVINNGVPICAFYGNVSPRRISNVLVRSRAPSSALILINRDWINSPNQA